jgi:hypothetical protein
MLKILHSLWLTKNPKPLVQYFFTTRSAKHKNTCFGKLIVTTRISTQASWQFTSFISPTEII